MIKKDHHIDAYFSDELKEFEVLPPQGVWNSIENKLNKKRRTGIIWFRIGMAAGIALIAGISGLVLLNHNNNSKIASNTLIINKTNTNKTSKTLTFSIDVEKKIISSAPKNNNEYAVKKTATKPTYNNTIKTNQNYDGDISLIIQNTDSTNNISEEKLVKLDPIYISLNSNFKNEIAALKVSDEKFTFNPIPIAEKKESFLAENNDRKSSRKWSVDGEFAPTYSYRAITYASDKSTSASTYNSNETGLVAWSGGFKINYLYNSRFSYQIGLYYSVKGQVILNVYQATQNKANYDQIPTANGSNSQRSIYIENSLGPITDNNKDVLEEMPQAPGSFNNVSYTNITNGESLTYIKDNGPMTYERMDAKIIQKLQYLEIPFLARYQFINKKIKWHFLAGCNAEILLNTKAFLKTSGSTEDYGKTINLKPNNISALAGIGFTFPVRSNINFLCEPTFKYTLNSVSNSTLRRVHLYSFNLYTGFSFNL
jgi:hypothetical protein